MLLDLILITRKVVGACRELDEMLTAKCNRMQTHERSPMQQTVKLAFFRQVKISADYALPPPPVFRVIMRVK